ncbi:hypothetical protein [Archaeoglobus veneficus]|uniref:Uncharacterized protein n=2 Tax=root TaxID=1 RepID=F2KMP6_ARCVS|nr:hypothetical protein [Archaeoglobus veneficus]AEA46070.1 hypothetical protein Arcve_0026 [Archaeoglobus veneficus SNP6]
MKAHVRRTGRFVKERYGGYYGGKWRHGRFGFLEACAYTLYVLAAATACGLGGDALSWFAPVSWLVVLSTMAILLFQKSKVEVTGVEIAAALVAICIPLMGLGIIPIEAATMLVLQNGFICFVISVLAAITVAYQD